MKRTKILAGLLAIVMALSVVGFGFSQWSSDLHLNGNVIAKASWNVVISQAEILRVSHGASVLCDPMESDPTVTVQAYNFYADYCTDFDDGLKEYRYHIDDEHPVTLTLTLEELRAFNSRAYIPGRDSTGYRYYMSGAEGADIQYMVKLTDTAKALGWRRGYTSCVVHDGGVKEGALLGVAIVEYLAGDDNPWGVQPAYRTALTQLQDGTASPRPYPATVSEDMLTATFPSVSIELPGAWAQYAVTLINNGSADASLRGYQLETEADDVVTVTISDLSNVVLAPGESYIAYIVVQVPPEYAEPTLDVEFALNVHLAGVPDAVEQAPDPSYTINF